MYLYTNNLVGCCLVDVGVVTSSLRLNYCSFCFIAF